MSGKYAYCPGTFIWALDGTKSPCELLAGHSGSHLAHLDGHRVEWTQGLRPVSFTSQALDHIILGHPVNEVLAMNKAPFACTMGHRWWVFSPQAIPSEMPCPFCMGKTG